MCTSEATTKPTTSPQGGKQRRALPRWVELAILLVVFAAGGVVGAMIATNVIHSRMQYYREHAPVFADDVVARLQLRLRLGDKQTEQVREIVERRHPRMIEKRKQGAQAMRAEFEAMEEEIAAVLNPWQARQWHAMADHIRNTYLPSAPGK